MKKKRNRPLLSKAQRKRVKGGIMGIPWDSLTEEQKQAFVDEQVKKVKELGNEILEDLIMKGQCCVMVDNKGNAEVVPVPKEFENINHPPHD